MDASWGSAREQAVAAVSQQHFDELAKGLATSRLSRGQVLKSFVAGLLLGGIAEVRLSWPEVNRYCEHLQSVWANK
jgi:hypothetical protein